MMKEKMAVLVVCMGNICRSPTAEAVLKAKAQQLGVELLIDSAGTIGYHQGNPPDPERNRPESSAAIRLPVCKLAKYRTKILLVLI